MRLSPCGGDHGIRISIITAVFNRAGTIVDCLQSVAGQSHEDLEHIIVDGASGDGTLEAIEANRHARIDLVSEPDNGIYDALNKGIHRSSGEIVGLLHSDDVFADKGVVERVVRRFEEGDFDCVYGDLDYVSVKGTDKVVRRWKAGSFRLAKLRHGWMPPHPTLFVRRQLLEQCGLYDTTFRIAADYKLVLQLFSLEGIRVGYLPEILVKMRTGGASNRSLRQLIRKSSEDYRALRQTGVGGAVTLGLKNVRKIGQFVVR